MPEVFVGDARRDVVTDLLDRFTELMERPPGEEKGAWWVALTAGSGWGKTSIVHELYRQLASDHQPSGAYWPSSLVPDDEVRFPRSQSRKMIKPVVVAPPRDSTPAWMWFGAECARRRTGEPAHALLADLAQWRLHEPTTTALARQLQSLLGRLKGSVPGLVVAQHGMDAAIDAAPEFLKLATRLGLIAASPMAMAVVQALGLATTVGSAAATAVFGAQTSRRVRAARTALQAGLPTSGAMTAASQGAAAAAEMALISQVIPIVVAVEDIHDVDDGLASLLRGLIEAPSARVLVVTTGHRAPGSDGPIPEIADLAGDRLVNIAVADTLTRADRRRIAEAAIGRRHYLKRHPQSRELADHLADRHTNPHVLELTVESARLADAFSRNEDLIEAVATIPREVRRMFEDEWEYLPIPVRRHLQLRAMSSPAFYGSGDDAWETGIVERSLAMLHRAERDAYLYNLTSVEEPISETSLQGRLAAWTRAVGDNHEVFADVAQAQVVADRIAEEGLTWTTRRRWPAVLAAGLGSRNSLASDGEIHRANLIDALLECDVDVPAQWRVFAQAVHTKAAVFFHSATGWSAKLDVPGFRPRDAYRKAIEQFRSIDMAKAHWADLSELATWTAMAAEELGELEGFVRELADRVSEDGEYSADHDAVLWPVIHVTALRSGDDAAAEQLLSVLRRLAGARDIDPAALDHLRGVAIDGLIDAGREDEARMEFGSLTSVAAQIEAVNANPGVLARPEDLERLALEPDWRIGAEAAADLIRHGRSEDARTLLLSETMPDWERLPPPALAIEVPVYEHLASALKVCGAEVAAGAIRIVLDTTPEIGELVGADEYRALRQRLAAARFPDPAEFLRHIDDHGLVPPSGPSGDADFALVAIQALIRLAQAAGGDDAPWRSRDDEEVRTWAERGTPYLEQAHDIASRADRSTSSNRSLANLDRAHAFALVMLAAARRAVGRVDDARVLRNQGLEVIAKAADHGAPLLDQDRLIHESVVTWLREMTEPAVSTKVRRNAPCTCGSGRKYKTCCGR